MLTRMAYYISYLFEPFVVSFLAWVLVISSLESTLTHKLIWVVLVIIISGLPPMAVLIYEKKIGKISDWFITKRMERRDVQLAWIVGALLLSILFGSIHAPRVLLSLSLSMFLISLVVTIISLFWKISVHMMGVSFLVMVLLLVYSPNWLWLVVLLPLVAWSRVKLGHHTLTQVTFGALATILITYFAFSLFGLATF